MKKIYNSKNYQGEKERANTDPWQGLSEATVELACKDYVREYRRFSKAKQKGKAEQSQYEMQRIEHFFRSDWCQALMEIDPEWLIRKLREKVENEKSRNKG